MAILPGRENLGVVVPTSRRAAASYRVIDSGRGDIAQAIGNAAPVVDKMLDRYGEAEAENAFNELRKKELELRDGALEIKGENAGKPDAFKKFEEDRRKFVEDKTSGLSERGKALFGRAANQLGVQFDGAISAHKRREMDVASDQAFRGTLETEKDLAGRTWADPEAVKNSADSVRLAIAKREADGLPKSAADALRINHLSQLHYGVASAALANRDVEYAKKYINENDSEIVDPKIRTALHENLKRAEVEFVADKEYQAVQGMSDAEALGYIAKIKDPIIRRTVKAQYGDLQDANRALKDEALNPTRTLLGDADAQERSISSRERDQVLTPLRATHPDLYDKASEQIRSHNDLMRRRSEEIKNRIDSNLDKASAVGYLKQRYDIMNNPEKYANPNTGKAIIDAIEQGKLSRSQGRDLLDLHTNILDAKKKGANPEGFVMFSTGEDYFNQRLRESTVDGKKVSEMRPAAFNAVRDKLLPEMDRYLRALQTDKQGKASKEEVRSAVDSMFVETLEEHWYGDNKKTEFSPTGALDRLPPNTANRNAIIERLKADGRPVTEDEIMKVWAARGR